MMMMLANVYEIVQRSGKICKIYNRHEDFYIVDFYSAITWLIREEAEWKSTM